LVLLGAGASASASPLGTLRTLERDPEDAALVEAVGVSEAGGALCIGDARELCRRLGAADRTSTPVDVHTVDGAALSPDIAWESAPQVAARARLRLPSEARVIALAGADPLLVLTARGAIVAADLADPSNRALVRWGYLPYVLHALVLHAAGRAPPRFADWPSAPVPHRALTSAWRTLSALLALALAAGFWLARQRARANPDAHLPLFAALAANGSPHDAAWARPGIARPLGGFFMFISATLLAMGPYLYITAVLVPSRVQPFPDADGLWAPIEDLAVLAWTLADFGMSTAFIKRFSEYRVSDPPRALRAAQLWVWWALGGSLLLLVFGGAIACSILPATHLALFSRVVLMRSLMQVQGICSLFTYFFSAIQRFDFQLALDLLQNRLLYVACPIPFILWLRAVGRAHPALGETYGAVLGIAAGQYCAVILTTLIGYWLYRRLKLPLAPLFYAGFDRATFSAMIRFGAGVVAGSAPFFIANGIEFAIITRLLPGYPSWLGIRQLIMTRLVFTVYFVWPFIQSAIPAVSEALAADKRELARYYVVRYLQFGHLFVGIVIAVLLGAGRPLVLYALSEEWRPVATYLPLACASSLFLPLGWLGDAFQKGAGRPGINAAILFGEQLMRVVLFYLLIPRLGFAGIFVAVLVTIVLKAAVSWTVTHRKIVRLVAWPWTSTLAPLTAGALVYLLLVGAAALMPATRPTAIALFVVAALGAFPLGFFFAGAVRGLDLAALDELDGAAELAGAMRPVAYLLARSARLGARIIGARHAPELAAEAQREADAIVATEHRV
jgi:O-antigen/teichoic acid export membrane protein